MTSRKTSEIYDTYCHVVDTDTVVVQGARFVRERTCRNISEYGENIGEMNVDIPRSPAFGFKCSSCLHDFDCDDMGNSPHVFDGEFLPINYCPNCGARVVE